MVLFKNYIISNSTFYWRDHFFQYMKIHELSHLINGYLEIFQKRNIGLFIDKIYGIIERSV